MMAVHSTRKTSHRYPCFISIHSSKTGIWLIPVSVCVCVWWLCPVSHTVDVELRRWSKHSHTHPTQQLADLDSLLASLLSDLAYPASNSDLKHKNCNLVSPITVDNTESKLASVLTSYFCFIFRTYSDDTR